MNPRSFNLHIKNSSIQNSNICVFTELPGFHEANMTSLAWLVEPSSVGDETTFTWTVDWGVFWKRTGPVAASEAIFMDSHTYPAQPKNGSRFSLEIAENRFVKMLPITDGQPGSIYVETTADIPNHGSISTGVTLCNKPCTAINAYPNTYYTFSTHVSYWLAFGSFVEGQNVQISTINQPIEVVFAANQYDLYYELGQDSRFRKVKEW